MEMKGITCKIPLELHNRISDEIRETESTMGKFIEMIINEHYTKEENSMSKGRTLAFQVSEEFFQRIKDYLARYEQVFGRKLSQRQFVIGLIEQALEEADEDFEAARADEDEGSREDPLEEDPLEEDQLEEDQPEEDQPEEDQLESGDPSEYDSCDTEQEADAADEETDNAPSEEA